MPLRFHEVYLPGLTGNRQRAVGCYFYNLVYGCCKLRRRHLTVRAERCNASIGSKCRTGNSCSYVVIHVPLVRRMIIRRRKGRGKNGDGCERLYSYNRLIGRQQDYIGFVCLILRKCRYVGCVLRYGGIDRC
ncbi:hypothetical protein Barb4_05164 [Bacteroidales bacterium Barb4]|nr:hypothetical protein Barb4_05164 [Bacteroidales bacterium Barb4]